MPRGLWIALGVVGLIVLILVALSLLGVGVNVG
jgi:hypothetical protein